MRGAALRGGEVGADDLLNAFDRAAEGLDVGFGQGRQRLDQHEAADFGGGAGFEWPERGEGLRLLRAVQAL